MFYILLGIYIVCALFEYTFLSYCEYRKCKKDRQAWADRSFAEWVYDGSGMQTDNLFIVISFIPIAGFIFFIVVIHDEYLRVLNIPNMNPFRWILKRIFKTRYRLDRVSKEI